MAAAHPAETPRPPAAKAPPALTRLELDDLLHTVNTKFGRGAELRLEAGREMLEKLFGDDAKLALSPESEQHPPWVAFRRLAGGRKLRPRRRQIRLAVRLAAWEKVIEGGFYANLNVGLREELLPLTDADQIREAAKRCIENNWGQGALARYVRNLTEAAGTSRVKPHERTARATVKPLAKAAETLSDPEQLEALAKALLKLSPDEREAAKETIDQVWSALGKLRKAMK